MIGRPVLLIYLLVEWYNLFPISAATFQSQAKDGPFSTGVKSYKVSMLQVPGHFTKCDWLKIVMGLEPRLHVMYSFTTTDVDYAGLSLTSTD